MNLVDVTKEEMADLIQDLIGHLDYCGWGDAWERDASDSLHDRAKSFLDKIEPPPVNIYDPINLPPSKLCPICGSRRRTIQAVQNHVRDKHKLRVNRLLEALPG